MQLWQLEQLKFKPENNLGLNGIRAHNLCDTGTVLNQLSYQANCKLDIVTSYIYP